ncbi:S41 family peptidase [Aquabacterium sp.]|uniref:S41 family peptidase n=1 Tax=Aquabacterium sp. TaxID=1872578 RepID=UPI002CB6107A|nr:S41 family peptidase [Aquabacterium sp.]HSW07707.1 S41 family peptidase [Aquabacterium sp.]
MPPFSRRALAVGLIVATVSASAQNAGPPIDAATRQQVIAGTIREMNAQYVFPEMATQVETALRSQQQAGAFDQLTGATGFADKLTEALQAVTRDKHIRMRFSATPLEDRAADRAPTAGEREAYLKSEQARNFGVEKVERLPGNIGYIELRGFASAELAGEAIAAAMNLVAHSQALIIDLRRNGGGDPATVALMSSYLFAERTHLNDMYWREGNRTEQFWTQDWVPGKRFDAKKPVYVLTSRRTFSGAEEFSYNLKNLKRATLIGETTGGGAHPGDMVKVATHFHVFIPSGRAINPISKTNWEGVGVEPDVKVAADDALRVAQVMALKPIVESQPDAEVRAALQTRLAELERGGTRPQ